MIGWAISRRPTTKGRDLPGFVDIEHGGVCHRIILKRVATARRFTLRVRAARGDVVLTMPSSGSAQAARAFALRHAGWVTERIGRLRRPVPFAPGSDIPLRGVVHRLVHRPGLRRRLWVERTEGDPSPLLCVSGPASAFAPAVQRYLLEQARHDLSEAAMRYAGLVRRRIRSITLRDTKSRWGSCTARGSLNFSWRLILAPPLVLDYLAAHEVAHLVHLNHSDAFWTLTHQLAPSSNEAEQWLKNHGADLHYYGAQPGGIKTPAGPSG